MSIRNKAISGVVWTVIDTFVLKGLSFITMIILARWLGPEQFGLIGMIAIFVAIGTSLTDSGMTASLIRTTDSDDKDYSTVFFLNLALSIGVYIIMFFSAPFIANFFNQPILTSLVRVYCLSFIISAFSAVQLAKLTAKMQFKKITKLNILGTVVGETIGLTMGYIGFGVWAIVTKFLVTQFIQSISLWFSAKWIPKLKLYSKEKALFHYGFGYKLMVSGLINTIFLNIYNLVIGKFYSVKELGYFERSKSLNNYPVTVITGVISKVTYPLLSSLKGDQIKVSMIYRKLMRLTFFITAPLMFVGAAIAKPMFLLILGKEWEPAIPYFQILCLSSMFLPIHAFNLNVFKVYGRSDLFLRLEIIKKIILALGLVVGFQFGIIGLVWSSVITNYLALFVNTYYSSGMINYSSKQQLFDMIPTFITGSITFMIVKAFIDNFSHIGFISQIVVSIIISLIVYFGLNKLIKSEPLVYLLKVIKERKFSAS